MKFPRLFRCVICNTVSDPVIETNAAESTTREFFRDKKRDMTVCANCQEIHEQIMSEFYIQDELKFNAFKK